MEYRISNNNELYHFGVPGMKWGRRKAIARPVSNAYRTGMRSNRGMSTNRQASTRSNTSSNNANRAQRIERGKSIAKSAVRKIAISAITVDALTNGALHKAGMNAVRQAMNRRAIPKIAQNHYYDPINSTGKIISNLPAIR